MSASDDEILLTITVGDIQNHAQEVLGRRLTPEDVTVLRQSLSYDRDELLEDIAHSIGQLEQQRKDQECVANLPVVKMWDGGSDPLSIIGRKRKRNEGAGGQFVIHPEG